MYFFYQTLYSSLFSFGHNLFKNIYLLASHRLSCCVYPLNTEMLLEPVLVEVLVNNPNVLSLVSGWKKVNVKEIYSAALSNDPKNRNWAFPPSSCCFFSWSPAYLLPFHPGLHLSGPRVWMKKEEREKRKVISSCCFSLAYGQLLVHSSDLSQLSCQLLPSHSR